MAVIKAVASHASVKNIVRYVTKSEKTEWKLLSGHNCNPETVVEEMEATKQLFRKSGGRTYAHFVQSFAPGEQITPEKAHEIARQWVDHNPYLQGFEVLVATHKDRDHIHTHFVINSVCAADGHKLHTSASDLQAMKDLSDQICMDHGLSICVKGRNFEGEDITKKNIYTQNKYRVLQKAHSGEVRSYVLETAKDVQRAILCAQSRDDFHHKLEEKGYRIVWEDNKKYIAFVDAEGHRVRNRNLEKTLGIKCDKEYLTTLFDLPESERISIQQDLRKELGSRLIRCQSIKGQLEYERNELQVRHDRAEQEWMQMQERCRQLDHREQELKDQLQKLGRLHVTKRTELKESLLHVDVERSGIVEYTEGILKQCGFDDYDAMQKAESQIKELNKQVRELVIELEYLNEIIDERFTTDNMEELNAELDIEIGMMVNDIGQSVHHVSVLGNVMRREIQQEKKRYQFRRM